MFGLVRSGSTGSIARMKGTLRGDAVVGDGTTDLSKVALVAILEGGGDCFSVCLAFSFEMGETAVSWIANDVHRHAVRSPC